jgi:hypothetical protein
VGKIEQSRHKVLVPDIAEFCGMVASQGWASQNLALYVDELPKAKYPKLKP